MQLSVNTKVLCLNCNDILYGFQTGELEKQCTCQNRLEYNAWKLRVELKDFIPIISSKHLDKLICMYYDSNRHGIILKRNGKFCELRLDKTSLFKVLAE